MFHVHRHVTEGNVSHRLRFQRERGKKREIERERNVLQMEPIQGDMVHTSLSDPALRRII